MEQFPAFFSAWRTIQIGSREVVDGLLRPDRKPGSPELVAFLRAWPGAWYWVDRRVGRVVLVRALRKDDPVPWLKHILLFVMTLIFSLAAGARLAGLWHPVDYPGFFMGTLRELAAFGTGLVQGDWRAFLQFGWAFAVPSLGILLIHELGHYWAARRYAIDATPPYFIPVPPTISPIGSFGAFIKARSPVIDRQQLADVGAAGPLAGFVVAVVVMIWGYLGSERVPAGSGLTGSFVMISGQVITLGDSLLTYGLREWLLPGGTAVHLSLPAFAGWVGLFLTGLNLLPLSQLDGGHVAYGFIGKRQGTLAIITTVALLWLSQYSWNWLGWGVMAFLIGGGQLAHPPVVIPDRPIARDRLWVGWACAVVFVVTFVPIPFS